MEARREIARTKSTGCETLGAANVDSGEDMLMLETTFRIIHQAAVILGSLSYLGTVCVCRLGAIYASVLSPSEQSSQAQP